MMTAFVIWTVVCGIFVLVGISSWRYEDPVGFFTGVKPPEVTDMKAYNHAVAKIWFAFAVVMEGIGIPLLFIEQNSPYAVLIILAVVALVIAIIIAYMRVLQKYKK